MKANITDLTGAALDWAVANADCVKFCEDRAIKISRKESTLPAYVERETRVGSFTYKEFSPSRDEKQGETIIAREEITVQFLQSENIYWAKHPKNAGGLIRYAASGPTPLIAAMRCYVSSVLGSVVDIPENV